MIGVFDSGYGGLTVMKEITAAFPQYDYLYLGDSARTPYGNRTQETITQFTEEGILFLFEAGARLIIIACNTSSTQALRTLQEKYLRNADSPYKDCKILGVIRPVAEEAARVTRSGRIGVVGTRATVASGAFEREVKNLLPRAVVLSQACPLLVPLIEEGWHTKPEARMILRKYLRPLKSHNVDTLILGCTHYPLMMKDFRQMIGKRVKVLDSGKIMAKSLAEYLERHPEIEKHLTRGATRKFFTTENPEKFEEFAKKFSGMKIGNTNKALFQ